VAVYVCVCDRDQWAGGVPSYQLQFTDGYQPERVYWDDEYDDSSSIDAVSHISAQTSHYIPVCQHL